MTAPNQNPSSPSHQLSHTLCPCFCPWWPQPSKLQALSTLSSCFQELPFPASLQILPSLLGLSQTLITLTIYLSLPHPLEIDQPGSNAPSPRKPSDYATAPTPTKSACSSIPLLLRFAACHPSSHSASSFYHKHPKQLRGLQQSSTPRPPPD